MDCTPRGVFNEGRWTQLLEEAQPLQPPVPRAEVATPEALAARAAQRARHLVHLGELSAARQALTSSALAPGTPETLQELRDPDRRPAEPYEALSHEVLDFQPDQVHLLPELMLSNERELPQDPRASRLRSLVCSLTMRGLLISSSA